MICPTFYDKTLAVQIYLGGKVSHYLRRDFTVTLQSYPYAVKTGDDMYSIALKVFGAQLQYDWTIIAENNFIKQPDDWSVGETMLLPSIILNDPETRVANYDTATSSSTPV